MGGVGESAWGNGKPPPKSEKICVETKFLGVPKSWEVGRGFPSLNLWGNRCVFSGEIWQYWRQSQGQGCKG